MREREILSAERRDALNRQVEQAKVQAQRESNAITKGAMDENRLENRKQKYLQEIQKVRVLAEDAYASERQQLAMALQNTKKPEVVKQAQQRLRDIDALIDAKVAKDAEVFVNEIDKIEGRLAGTGGSGAGGGFKILSKTPTK
jgi:hypothetical protein